MLKLDEFTKDELDILRRKLNLSPLQEKIFDYRSRDFSIVEMAMLESCSESKINKEIKKIKKKIVKVL